MLVAQRRELLKAYGAGVYGHSARRGMPRIPGSTKAQVTVIGKGAAAAPVVEQAGGSGGKARLGECAFN